MTTIEYSKMWQNIKTELDRIITESTPLNTVFSSLVDDDQLDSAAIEHCMEKLNSLHPDCIEFTPLRVLTHHLIMLSHSIKSLYRVAC